MSGVANSTAYSILAALEGQENVDETSVSHLPEVDEVRREREARELALQKKMQQRQFASQQQQQQQNRAKGLPPKLTLPSDIIKRTRMCEDWLGSGRCRNGSDCVFAHDVQEMNQNRAKVKLYQAEQYRKMGYAEHAEHLTHAAHSALGGGGRGGGSASSSLTSSPSVGPLSARSAPGGTAHPAQQYTSGGQHLMMRPALYRTKLCRNFFQGQCRFGDTCFFAHGEQQLRENLHEEAAVQEELSRWGLQGEAGPSTAAAVHQQYRDGDAAGPSTSAAVHVQSSSAGGYGQYAYGGAAAGAATGAAGQYGPPSDLYAYSWGVGSGGGASWAGVGGSMGGQAQQASAPGDFGAKQMDPGQLAALLAGLDFSEEENYPAFICPITHERFTDPVVAADGYTYERGAIASWLGSGRSTSPMTNDELEDTVLIPNLTLREAMRVVLGG